MKDGAEFAGETKFTVTKAEPRREAQTQQQNKRLPSLLKYKPLEVLMPTFTHTHTQNQVISWFIEIVGFLYASIYVLLFSCQHNYRIVCQVNLKGNCDDEFLVLNFADLSRTTTVCVVSAGIYVITCLSICRSVAIRGDPRELVG